MTRSHAKCGGTPPVSSPDVSKQAPIQAWTTRRLLAWMAEAFTKKGLDSPRLMGELLVAHVIGCERLRLYMDPDRPATPLERDRLRDLVARALKHEPVQYLTGEAWFFSLPFKVRPGVFIPRPGTETIVQHVLQHARVEPGFGGADAGADAPEGGGRGADAGGSRPTGQGVLFADLCTGSGCVAVALAKNMPMARGVAVDVSEAALETARANAARHGVADRLDFLHGDLLDALDQHPVARAKGSLAFLVSNPPYIPDHEWAAVPPNVREHEPESALRGGVDGLDFVRPLFARGPAFLRPGGLILVEVAESTAAMALELALANPELGNAAVLQDHEGLARVVVARKRT